MQKLYEEEIFLISFLQKNYENIFTNNFNKIKTEEVNLN